MRSMLEPHDRIKNVSLLYAEFVPLEQTIVKIVHSENRDIDDCKREARPELEGRTMCLWL